jgi:hypothetical protein
VEARAQGLDPRVDRFRAVLEHQKLAFLRASGLEANIVLGTRPGEANKCRKSFGGVWLLWELPVCGTVGPRDMPAGVL